MSGATYTLSTREAAEKLGVSLDTVGRWADAGRIPHLRTPGGWRKFRPIDIQRFAASLEREQTA